MLQPMASSTSTWPIAGDAPDLTTIVQAQAIVIHDNAELIEAYQTVLDNNQALPAPLPAALGNGTASGTPATTLTVSNVTQGNIVVNARIIGPGIPTGTTIVSQTSGTVGGAGVYVTSVATTASSAALTFVPPQPPMPWPPAGATDVTDLNALVQQSTAVIRTQTALLQQYQDLLNTSQTPPPPTGP